MPLRIACSPADTANTAVPEAGARVARYSCPELFGNRGALRRERRMAILLGAVQIRAP